MANKKKISRASKRRLVFFGTFSVLVIGYFLFSALYYTYKINNLKLQEKKLNEKLTKLQKEERILSNDMERLKDPDYLAKYAREIYSYSKDDEVVIQKYDKEEEQVEETKFEFSVKDKYILYSCVLIFIFVIIYIICKSINKKKKKQH